MDLHEQPALELARMVRERRVSSLEVVEHFLRRIASHNGRLNCMIRVMDDAAREQAREVDRRIASGEALSPLAGVPIVLKDNMVVAGHPTTCGSRILEPFRPIYDAAVVERLRAAGLPVLGKTNLDEFAMGSSTEHSAFGPSSNPWDSDRVPGGSSGGSAVAVAARLSPLALGSDTGGSVRQPASMCGVLGIKPTYGAVSRYGLVAYASSLDQIGGFAIHAGDLAALMSILMGHDPRDSTSAPGSPPVPAMEGLDPGLDGMRIGVVDEMMGEGISPDTRTAVDGAIETLRSQGATIRRVSMPSMRWGIPAYYVIACAEASSNLARYDGVRYGIRPGGSGGLLDQYKRVREAGFGPEAKRRIMLGTFVLSSGYHDAYYGKAQKVRTLVLRDFRRALEDHDVLVGPVAPDVAFRKGEKCDDPVAMYLADICTVAVNLAGAPGMSVPCGFSRAAGKELPIGFQVMGRPFDERTLLRVGYSYQKVTPFHRRLPPL